MVKTIVPCRIGLDVPSSLSLTQDTPLLLPSLPLPLYGDFVPPVFPLMAPLAALVAAAFKLQLQLWLFSRLCLFFALLPLSVAFFTLALLPPEGQISMSSPFLRGGALDGSKSPPVLVSCRVACHALRRRPTWLQSCPL